MDKIIFDHSKETIAETMGVSGERDDQIFDTVKAIFLNGGNDVCKHIEQAIEELSPESPAEYLLIGFKYAHVYHQAQQKESAKIRRALLANLLDPDAQKI